MPRRLASWLLPGGFAIRRKGLLLSVILILIFSFAPLAQTQDTEDSDSYDSHVRIVRISYVDGEVRMDSGHGFENVTMNVPVTERDWLQTRSDGWAEVQFEDGSLLRLAPDSQVVFTELGRWSSGGTVTTVDLDQGEAEFKITKHDDSDFHVTVKNKTIMLVHSATFRVTSTNADPMEVVVFKGEVSVRDPESGSEIAVKKNETFVLDSVDLARYALETGAEADSLDEWSKQRDDSLSEYAAARAGTQSPYQYGASDLNFYGQYYDVPDYGNVWQPKGVGLGWDPFSNGYWAYSPGFGYTWVSSYRWGWLPFRYGRWVFVNGRGWCWAPGGWNRWHRQPRWANAPPGFRPPVPPADHKIVGGAPGQIIRPGNRGAGGAGDRGPGGRIGDRDRDNFAGGEGTKGSRRVLTNDDVQAKVPRTDIPQPQPPVPVPIERKPAIVDQHQPTQGGGEIHRGDENRFRGDRVPPVSHANETPSTPSQPVRQFDPPPQSYSPPNRQPERMNTPPPQPAPRVNQPAPPAPPMQHYAPPPAAAPQSQSGPPPESHSRASDESSRGRPR